MISLAITLSAVLGAALYEYFTRVVVRFCLHISGKASN